ncbi:MAG: hypothetical protein PWR06_1129 [Thermoanaerobacteraceae bacterium]|nr:hypothetical protein [Thermoanaerobacteraceae bacterium]MDN5302423.1 hypothetical protein [Thermoanaerobacteraceae bacterium]MDN5311130.1 hypothetical protein [Thermoanaerobacteraceae bacterium]RKL63526.1 TRAP transporter substrate-binding protein [Thermoanaerobacteraceae bacterium SP2]
MSFFRSKKVVLLTCVVLLLFALVGCGQQAGNTQSSNQQQSSQQQSQQESKPQEQMVLKLAENQPEDYPTTIGDKEFAKIVEEKTNGRIKIEVYAGGQLGDEKSVIEAVQMGGIDFARVNAQPLSDFAKPLRVLSLPYLFDNREHLWKVLDGPIGDEILDTLKDASMIGLAYYDSGARSFYNSKHEVKTPADLKGLKIRVQQSELMVGLVEALGASATPMAYGEVYSGLQTGVIDGAENNWPSYYSTSHYEVAKYYTLDYHTMTPEVVIASKALWDKLSDEDKKIIKEAARASEETQKKAWQEYEKKSIEAVKAKGNVITEVKDLKPWQDAVKPLYDKFGADYKDLIEKIKAAK